ncbi:MAG TPA: hypothetical protein VE130_16045, partial [Nitrososphaeraceae archaeon]|nr:hypothetical protein [Nitrososphaeraceae archaeon]
FLDNLHALTTKQWRKMLSYADSDQIKSENPLVAKLIELNIEGFKKVFEQILIFRNTHIQIFRRYKHAGLPIRPGFEYKYPFPFTSVKFDSYSMVSVGPNPLVDVIPLPYSEDVIESYNVLLEGLETRITDIVQNKMECIRQRKKGVIPTQNYSPAGTFSSEEDDKIVSAINEYDIQYPNRAYYDIYDLKLSVDSVQEMKWYLNLEDNMEKWKQQAESESHDN